MLLSFFSVDFEMVLLLWLLVRMSVSIFWLMVVFNLGVRFGSSDVGIDMLILFLVC